MPPKTISATKFKAECLRIMDEVARTRQPVVITKHRKAVAQLAPVAAASKSILGRMKGTFKIAGDLVAPPNPLDDWDEVSR